MTYFVDLPNGQTFEFRNRRELRLMLPNYPTMGSKNELCGFVKGKGWIKITRTVNMKTNPSRHDCDSRCYNATGRTMNCECACGGKNHGKGRVRMACEAA